MALLDFYFILFIYKLMCFNDIMFNISTNYKFYTGRQIPQKQELVGWQENLVFYLYPKKVMNTDNRKINNKYS